MKRVIIMLSCVALVLALAVPCFAVSDFIDPVDYIVSESANGDNNYINVRVPSDVLTITWEKYKSGNWSNSQKGSSATFPADSTAFDIYTNISPSVDITSLVDGTTITMQYEVSNNAVAQPRSLYGRWFFRYLDIDGNLISDQITTIDTSGEFNNSFISTTLDKPDNATHMTLYFQWLSVTADSSFTVTVTGLKFSCLVSALQRVQQETGKTNELLDKAINGKVEPTPPEFDDSMNQAINKEDSLVNMFPDGTLDNFGGNVAGLMDSLLLYAGAFGLVKAIWEPFIELEWFNIILTASLALGLLGAVLGTFLTTSKASNHDGKGKD